MIKLTDITLMRGSKTLFQDANLTIHTGHKIGLVGANGTGKSSLFSLLRKQLHQDQGEIAIPKAWTIAWMAQEIENIEPKTLDFVLQGDSEYFQLKQQLQHAEHTQDAIKIADIHQQLDSIDGYTAESRAATLLHGLGFSTEQLSHSVASFSGGWRVRLNLAKALMCRSDLLLLDEPTNHLDLDTLIWLENWLKSYQGTLVVISHDRDFLDAVVSDIVHIEQQQVKSYSGNYSTFEKTRSEQLALQQAMYQKQQRQAAHLQSFIDRFKAKASKAKQAQSRVKMLEKLQTEQAAHVDSQFQFQFRAPNKVPNPLLYLEKVSAGYDDKLILEHVHLNLVPGSRIGLLGRNGAGKSTLIKLLAKQLPAVSGNYETRQGLEIGYFAQHQLELIRTDESPLQHLQRLFSLQTEQQHRDFLGGFGFHGDKATDKTERFSGGEKARLVLALIVMAKPNLLLLDEPTNHLDLEMRQALTFALQAFEGAMVIVSHDRHLLRSVCDEFYLVNQQRVESYSGTLDDYEQWMLKKPQQTNQTSQQPTNNGDKKQQKRREAEQRQRLSPLNKQLSSLEKKIDRAQTLLHDKEAELSDTNLYQQENKQQLNNLLQQQVDAKNQLESLEFEWLELQEQIEQIVNGSTDPNEQ